MGDLSTTDISHIFCAKENYGGYANFAMWKVPNKHSDRLLVHDSTITITLVGNH